MSGLWMPEGFVQAVPKVTLAGAIDDLLVYAREQLAKASLPAAIAERDGKVGAFAGDVAAYFDAMATRVLGTVSKALEIEWDPRRDVDWTVEDRELGAVLARWYVELGETAFAAVADQLGIELRFDVRVTPAKDILDQVGERVRGINDVSRDVLSRAVETSITEGESVADLRTSLRSLFDGWSTTRAQTVALTETATVYNEAALAGYAESGLVDTVRVFDGADCGWTSHDDADLASGSERTLDEAAKYPTSHPNCQRAFGPVAAR